MKYSAILVALVAGAFARPQEASTITSAPASAASVSLTPQQSCATACPAGDVTCQAACFGVARPNSSQASETNECAAQCDQGDGSPEATEKYAECQQACFASLFPSTQTAGFNAPVPSQAASNAASATNAAETAASSGASQAVSGTGAESTPSGSASGSAASTTPTGAANANNAQYAGAAGIVGLFALFAL
ncbi:hypothetical protein CC78DRAFT_574020 [Lojkania enalia]|uniref:Uncharacterized protein n=1 Tax=Lojkania enalia TaxID=147567 RepID=A0A9P4TRV3_9PLEO|nr:hypothetical protein CC78DRAFT_574020 [Didymosphaeria enalia]